MNMILLFGLRYVDGDLEELSLHVNNSWLKDLDSDPAQSAHCPNKQPRNVGSGHWVLVAPTPLPHPVLISHSPGVAESLWLDPSDALGPIFTRLFSGHAEPSIVNPNSTWATPYALSIYGHETIPEGAGPDGDGYGDGRAISLAEIIIKDVTEPKLPVGWGGSRLELQMKGAGKTPFCRGGDGRAVLRSSARFGGDAFPGGPNHSRPQPRGLCVGDREEALVHEEVRWGAVPTRR